MKEPIMAKERNTANSKCIPDYGPKWWLKRLWMRIWWRWASRKPPIVH